MKSIITFTKKEFLDHYRNKKLLILLIIFVILGIMSPAIAKLTPLMMELMADSLKESGILVTNIKVDALTSWQQFYKNIPLGLLAFVLIESNIFTKEYQSQTLTLPLTKGLNRISVVISKVITMIVIWSIVYWLCFIITYSYNAYFFDNSIIDNLFYGIICFWIFGIWIISLMALFSTRFISNTSVLTTTGIMVFIVYLISLIPTISKYLPTALMNGLGVIDNLAIVVTIAISWILLLISIPIFNKKQI